MDIKYTFYCHHLHILNNIDGEVIDRSADSKIQTYNRNTACENADDLRHAASRSVHHALSCGLKEQHTGQVKDQSWVLRLLQLLNECLTMKE